MKFASGLRDCIAEHRLPWRLTHRGGLVNTVVVAPLARLCLPTLIGLRLRCRPNDVNVVLGVKNRGDYRLRNALACLRRQSYPKELIKITVVDYGSDPAHAASIRAACESCQATYFAVPDATDWNRSHCLNVGIKHSRSKFLLISDVDVLFESNFVAEGIKHLLRHPLSAVYSQMWDLPEQCNRYLSKGDFDPNLELVRMRGQAEPRTTGAYHLSIFMAMGIILHLIHGFDERYRLWGGEDDDMALRLYNLGLRSINLDGESYYLHQWHPRREGMPLDDWEMQYQKNLSYLHESRSIIRNPCGWGEVESLSREQKLE